MDPVAKKEGKTIFEVERRLMHIIDPTSSKRLMTLQNPKIPIRGFRFGARNCINLHQEMKEKYPAPKFGYVAEAGSQLAKDVQDPWTLMLGVVAAKEA